MDEYAQFNLRMPRELKKKMLMIALKKDLTVTEIAQKLFEDYVKKESS